MKRIPHTLAEEDAVFEEPLVKHFLPEEVVAFDDPTTVRIVDSGHPNERVFRLSIGR